MTLMLRISRGPARGGPARLGGAARGECGGRVERVLLAESVGLGLSPSARVVVLLKSDFLGFYC
jgi:hypothetical protein